MKRSKIILGVLILSVMALVLSGCGEGDPVAPPLLGDNVPYALRGIGPAGGYIFYDKGSYSDGWRYLEAAPAPASTEWKQKYWGSFGTLIGGTETGIGTGQSNTTKIVAWLDANGDDTYGDVTNKTDRAAYLCDSLTEGGYSDWFLPSKDELNKMWVNLKSGTDENDVSYEPVGGFAGHYYWSSSEFNANFVWYQNFLNGNQVHHNVYNNKEVRAVRAF